MSLDSIATSPISSQDLELYDKYLTFIRDIGQLEDKVVTDTAQKTIYAENWTGYLPLVGRVKRWYWGSFDYHLVEEALMWLSDKRKEARSKPHLRLWYEEITNEFRKVGITRDLDFKALLKSDTADKIDCVYIGSGMASLECPGLKNTIKQYIGKLGGQRMINAVALAAMDMENDPPSAPSILGNPLLASIAGKNLRKTNGPSEAHKHSAQPMRGAQLPAANLADIVKQREALKPIQPKKDAEVDQLQRETDSNPLLKSLRESSTLRKFSVEKREGSSYIVDHQAIEPEFRRRLAQIKASNHSQDDLARDNMAIEE